MSWRFTSIRRGLARFAVACIALLAAATGGVAAKTIELAIMPGEVVRGHAKIEAECEKCHVRMNRGAQTGLCLDCHKPVAQDVKNHTGHHGRLRNHECRGCHTEHKGRGARIVNLDEKKFDHAMTDFILRGRHVELRCAKCHRPDTRHAAAPGTCVGCHRDDDKHKSALGAKCENCHTEKGWKETSFDHAKTRFPLLNSHTQPKCTACHTDQQFANTPRDCNSCHRKDDAHKGLLGPRCESCHTETRWKTPSFKHDRDTHFALRDKHRTVKCDACHRGPVASVKTPTACYSCHRADDPHKHSLGEKCESCHTEKGWKTARFDHDRDSQFPLRDKHKPVKCDGCHKEAGVPRKLATTCVSCHERDDREKGHQGKLGRECENCHRERGWRDTTFDHKRTRFALLGRHASAECKQCHVNGDFTAAKNECLACHLKNDSHQGRFGARCEDCHDARVWKNANFDHNQKSAFKLLGAHVKITCHACHEAPVRPGVARVADCASCHARKDDVHFGSYGAQCERCHVPDNWRKIINRQLLPPPAGGTMPKGRAP